MREIPFITSSIVNTYISCKYSFWDEFINNDGYSNYRNNDESDEPIYLLFGTLIHGVIEQFWKNPQNRTKKFLINTYENDLVCNGFTDKGYIELGYEMIDKFFNYLKTEAPKRKALHSELSFKVTIGGVPLHGTIDQIFYHGDGIYEIEDYKTSKWLPTQDEVDENIQLSMYDLVFSNPIMKEYWFNGIEPKAIILSLHFLRHGTVIKSERNQYSRTNALSYFRLIYRQMQTLEDKKFIPTLNGLCNYCDKKETCPLYQSVVDDTYVEPTPEEYENEATYYLEMYHSTKNRIKILEEKSNEYYAEVYDYLENSDGRPMSCSDGYDYFLVQNGRRYVKTDKAIKILEENNLWNPKDFISSLPIGQLESMLKDHPDVMHRISTFAMGYNYSKPKLSSKKSPKLFKRSKSSKR